MFKNSIVSTTPSNKSHTIRIALIVFMLVIFTSLCFGMQSTDINKPIKPTDPDDSKTFDYVLNPEQTNGLSFDSTILAILTRYQNNEKNDFRVGLTYGETGRYWDSVTLDFVDNSTAFSSLHISFEGINTNIKICGGNYLYAETGTLYFKFRNLNITSEDIGTARGLESGYNLQNNAMIFLTLELCIVEQNSTEDVLNNGNMSGAGVYSVGPVTIDKCDIRNNTGRAYADMVPEDGNCSKGGGLYIENDSSYPAVIQDSRIYNNVAIAGGGAYITGDGTINFIRNTIYNNTRSHYNDTYNCLPYAQNGAGEGVWCFDAKKLNISSNIFRNQISASYSGGMSSVFGSALFIESCGGGSFVNRVKVHNNTIAYNTNCYGLRVIEAAGYMSLSNNLVYQNHHGFIVFGHSLPFGRLTISYNDCFQNWEQDDGYNPTQNVVSQNYNIPVLLDANYVPVWNTTTKAFCIDNGNPDLDGDGLKWYEDADDREYDGSQLDIGAKPLVDAHIHSIHQFNNDQISWVSFPGIYNPANPQHTPSPESSIDYIFNSYHDNNMLALPPYAVLREIICKTNQSNLYVTPENIPEHYVSSQNGYIVRLRSDYEGDKVMEYQGYRPGTPLNAGMYVDELGSYTQGLFIKHPADPASPDGTNCTWDPIANHYLREIYLGYYQPESLKPRDALAPIWNDIIGVYAEDWAMVRLPQVGYNGYTENWLEVDDDVSDGIAINSGEMVIVYYIGDDDVDFKWGGDNPNPPFVSTYTRELPSHFGYEEQPEYVPIFVTLNLAMFDENEKPLEIAIFVNNECKGASIIKEDQVQLNAYILNDPTIELEDLEFRMYFPAKSADLAVCSYSTMNYATGKYMTGKTKVADCGRFLNIKLDGANDIPQITSLMSNFPNPFNPETTIKYNLAKTGKTKLEVYNIKGQLVKKLVDEDKDAGYHSIKWNGTDDSAKPVSSGVYFYRLTADGKCLTNKMLMLK